MAIAHETTLFDVEDCKVYALTSDVTGASPVYGAAVDVPGIANVGLDPTLVTAVLKGDARVLSRKGRVDSFRFTATYGKLDLDVLPVIMQGTTTPSGVTPNQKVAFRMLGNNKLPYFKIEFRVLDVDPGLGDAHVVLYKAQLTGGTLFTGQTDQFGQPSMEVEAIGLDGTLGSDVGVMFDAVINETAVTII